MEKIQDFLPWNKEFLGNLKKKQSKIFTKILDCFRRLKSWIFKTY